MHAEFIDSVGGKSSMPPDERPCDAHCADRERRMLAALAHDLRTPIAILQGYLDMLADEGTFDAEQAEIIERLKVCSRRLDSMVEHQLSAFRERTESAPSTQAGATVDRVARAVLLDYRPLARDAGVLLAADLCDESVRVAMDEVALHRILANLIGNALKFTPRGGMVRVAARLDGGFVHLSVRDSGPGIAAERLPNLFASYRDGPGEREGGGCGLGLSIVEELAKSSGGQVDVVSPPGDGAEFRVALPRIAESRGCNDPDCGSLH